MINITNKIDRGYSDLDDESVQTCVNNIEDKILQPTQQPST